MNATPAEQITALQARYSNAIRALPDFTSLMDVIAECEQLIATGGLAGKEKAVAYRLLGEALFFVSQAQRPEREDDLERAGAALLASHRYFDAELDHRAVAALEVLIAETIANLAMLRYDGVLMVAARRRVDDAMKRILNLRDTELENAAATLVERIKAWEEARRREFAQRPRRSGTGRVYSIRDPEELARQTIDGAVSRQRLRHLDAEWHASPRHRLADGDPVECGVFCPAEVPPDTPALVQVFVYLPDHEKEAARRASAHDSQSALRGTTTLDVEVEMGARLCFELNLPEATIEEPFQSLVWKSQTAYVTFSIAFADSGIGPHIGKLLVTINDVPVGVIRFLVTVLTNAPRDVAWLQTRPTGRATRYASAFISYARQDRGEVIRRVQMLEALGIKYFKDLMSLQPGERWKEAVYRALDDSDLFLLFWSSAASESSYVREEIAYAIKLKSGDDEASPEIIPIVIEGPPAPAAPPELAHLQFSDRILYFLPRQKAVVRDRWTTCPHCGIRFATYGQTWNGRAHTSCGASLDLVEGD